jgi:hypothetical protein
MTEMLLTCSKCLVQKRGSEFVKDPQRKTGRSSHCKECKREHGRKAYANIPKEYQRERVAAWRESNPERTRELDKASHERNKDRRNAYSREYRANNLERMRMLSREWSRNNPEVMRATNNARRAAKAQAIPKWANDEFDLLIVSECFDLAVRRTKATGVEWHVDHIVPLRSEKVCGLHCAANVRVITATENHGKGNRTWPNMPT